MKVNATTAAGLARKRLRDKRLLIAFALASEWALAFAFARKFAFAFADANNSEAFANANRISLAEFDVRCLESRLADVEAVIGRPWAGADDRGRHRSGTGD